MAQKLSPWLQNASYGQPSPGFGDRYTWFSTTIRLHRPAVHSLRAKKEKLACLSSVPIETNTYRAVKKVILDPALAIRYCVHPRA